MAADSPANSSADSDEECLASIQAKLSKLSSDTPNYGTVCIYKVPEKHRNKNQEAYTPKLVSIGFVHHGQNQLQAMEEYKLRYLNDFINTFQVSLEELVEFVKAEKHPVCLCYEDNCVSSLSEKHKTPSEVILLDGVFVIELFLKNHFVELRENGDRMFDNSWVSNEILHDMLLFENQLPLKFLHKLYADFVSKKLGTWLDNSTVHPPSLYELAHKYFKDVGNTGKVALTSDFEPARHFLEFLSIMHKPDNRQNSRDILQQSSLSLTRCGRLYGSCLTCIDPRTICGVGYKRSNKDDHVERKFGFKLCPTSTRLNAAGVKFEKGTGNCFLDVDFNKEKGVLRIPPQTVNDFTETFFRNLIAFEQSGIYYKYTTSMVILLDNLIDTAQDVDILIKHEIITNELGSSQQVADLFNTLYKDFVPDQREFYFDEECRQLNDYSRDPLHKINAELTRWGIVIKRHFNTPLTIVSFIVAVILLALTATQTAYSVISVKKG